MTVPLWIRAGPQLYVGALVLGIGLAVARRFDPAAAVAVALLLGLGSPRAEIQRGSLCLALVAAGWWWGSVRLDALDRSVLLGLVDTSERSLVVVTAPPRHGPYEVRVPVQVRRFGRLVLREPALLVLPPGRGPPQGTIVEAVTTARLPRSAEHGFDERALLRRRGIHVVLRADRWRAVGRRGGLGGLADRLRERLSSSAARGLGGRAAGARRGRRPR